MSLDLSIPTLAYPRYHFPTAALLQVLAGVALGRPRSFQADAHRLAVGIQRLRVLGEVPPPESMERGWLITPNHYARSGFGVWWLALALSAVFPADIHWVMTSAWRGAGLAPWASRPLFPRVARMYGFTSTPPMPPDPAEQPERAAAIRHLFQYARTDPCPVIGFAPEGMDLPAGGLMQPYPGVGRMLAHLSALGLNILPVGVYEAGGCLCLSFGRPYRLALDLSAPHAQVGAEAARQVMHAIAACLPEDMRKIHPHAQLA